MSLTGTGDPRICIPCHVCLLTAPAILIIRVKDLASTLSTLERFKLNEEEIYELWSPIHLHFAMWIDHLQREGNIIK